MSRAALPLGLALALVLSLVPRAVRAETLLRVAPTGADAPACGSAAAPCRSIQYAVNLVATSGTVLVAGSPGGTSYGYDAALDPCSGPLGNTAAVCIVNKQILLRGGYSTADWTTSDPVRNPTTIDGASARRGVLAIGTGPLTTLDIEGFTIRDGLARGTPLRPGLDSIYAFGGGLQADEVASLRVRRVLFVGNRAVGDDVAGEFGGAGSGGGVALRWVDDAVFEDVRFEANEALGGTGAWRGGFAVGGGLYTFQSKLGGARLVFRDNASIAGGTSGGGIGADGERADAFGGAAAFQQGSVVSLQEVAARDNAAFGGFATSWAGGAFGGAFKLEEASLALLEADLRGNTAIGGAALNGWLGNGGAIEAIHSHTSLDRVTMIGNVAQGGDGTTGNRGAAGGGAVNATWMRGADSTLDIRNSVVAGNSVRAGGGTNVSGGGGGGLWIQATTATVTHTTIADNLVDGSMQGQAVLLIEAPVGAPDARHATAAFAYDVVARHAGFAAWQMAALHVKPGNSLVTNRAVLSANTRDTNVDGVPGAAGSVTGLATALHPASAGFAAPGEPAWDYHLVSGSAARDQATGSTAVVDVDGDTRSAPDVGADEYAASGGLSGTVRDAAGRGLAGVLVEVFDAATRAPAGSAMSASGGAWSVYGLQRGSYRVRFSDGLATLRFVARWWNGREEVAADLVGVAAGAVTRGIDTTLDAPEDALFVDDFESGSLGRWSATSTKDGKLAVRRIAARHGAAGLLFDVDRLPPPANRAKLWVKDTTPAGVSRYRARFSLDLNTIEVPTDPRILRLAAGRLAGDPSHRPFELRLRFEASTWTIYGVVRDDGGTARQTVPIMLPRPGWASVELDWRRASGAGAGDGTLTLKVDGTTVVTPGVDNHLAVIDGVQLGFLGGLGVSSRGTAFIDDFESRTQSDFAALP